MIIIILNLTAILAAPVKIPMDIALPSPVAALAENRAVSFPNSIPANSYGGHILESIAGKNQLIHGAGLETGVPHNLANGRPPISPTAPFFKSNSRPPASFISGQVDA